MINMFYSGWFRSTVGRTSVFGRRAFTANSAFHPFGIDKLSSEQTDVCRLSVVSLSVCDASVL